MMLIFLPEFATLDTALSPLPLNCHQFIRRDIPSCYKAALRPFFYSFSEPTDIPKSGNRITGKSNSYLHPLMTAKQQDEKAANGFLKLNVVRW